MSQIKTAISIDETLFSNAERLAAELELSRSSLYALALKELLERRESQLLLDELNAAYGTPIDQEAEEALGAMRERRKRLAAEDPWK